MRNIVVLIAFVLALFPINNQAISPFEDANNFYAKGDYQKALESYENVEVECVNKYYNMGNCYYQLKNYPLAIYNYQVALKYDPTNKEILENLILVNRLKTDKFEGENLNPNLRVKTLMMFGIGGWGMLAFTFALVGFIGLVLYLFLGNKLKRFSFFFGVVMLLLGLVFLIPNAYQSNYLNGENKAVVAINNLKVNSNPSEQSKELFILHEGTTVEILESNETHYNIKTPNKLKGWVSKDALLVF